MGLLSPKHRQVRPNSAVYVRHRPETTLLYQIVNEYWPEFQAALASQGKHLPTFICREFEAYLKCGRLEHGFLRIRCETCHDEKLVAFSCKRRGFCPSCGARRMTVSAALLVDEVLPHKPMRQLSPGMACSRAMQELLPRVLSVPFPLRFLFASQPAVMGKVLGINDMAALAHPCATRHQDVLTNGHKDSSASSTSILKPAVNAAVRCASLPASKTRW